jgi:hypothetical protein
VPDFPLDEIVLLLAVNAIYLPRETLIGGPARRGFSCKAYSVTLTFVAHFIGLFAPL